MGEKDPADAINLYKRGVYFDSNDYMTVTNFELNLQFSIQVWVRPDLDQNSALFTTQDLTNLENEGLLKFALQTAGVL